MSEYQFERKNCGRCGGSGHYSYNPKDGTVCFGCGGKGTKLTKKGKAANDYFNSLLETKSSDLKVGDSIWQENYNPYDHSSTYYWTKIVEIKEQSKDELLISTKYMTHQVSKNKTFQRYPQDDQGNSTKDAFRALKQVAVEYQSKLTQQGKLMKKYQNKGE